jgi:hypothetical protein
MYTANKGSGYDLCIPRNETAGPCYFQKQDFNVLSPNFNINVSVTDPGNI